MLIGALPPAELFFNFRLGGCFSQLHSRSGTPFSYFPSSPSAAESTAEEVPRPSPPRPAAPARPGAAFDHYYYFSTRFRLRYLVAEKDHNRAAHSAAALLTPKLGIGLYSHFSDRTLLLLIHSLLVRFPEPSRRRNSSLTLSHPPPSPQPE